MDAQFKNAEIVEMIRPTPPAEVFCAMLSSKIRATRGGRLFGESFPHGDLETRKKRESERERGNVHTPPQSGRRKPTASARDLGNLLANKLRYGCRGQIHGKERQTVKSRSGQGEE